MKLDEPTDESEIILAGSKFDQCELNQCSGTKTAKPCPGIIQRWHFETKARKTIIVYTDQWSRCPCKCHGKVVDSVTKPRRRRRRK